LLQRAQDRTLASVPKPLDEVAKALRDAAYVTVGLGVIAVQRAQVQRRELQKSLGPRLDDARTAIEDNVKLVEERLRAYAER
jgi:hypothetical protein